MTTIFNVEKCDAYRWKADKILVSTVCITVLYLIWLRSKVQTRLRRIFSKVQNFWPSFLLKLWRQFRFFSNKLIFFNQIPLFVSFQVYECLKVSKFVRNTIKNSDLSTFSKFFDRTLPSPIDGIIRNFKLLKNFFSDVFGLYSWTR